RHHGAGRATHRGYGQDLDGDRARRRGEGDRARRPLDRSSRKEGRKRSHPRFADDPVEPDELEEESHPRSAGDPARTGEQDEIAESEVVKKLQEGSHMNLVLEEVEEFARALGVDKAGEVSLWAVKDVLTTRLDPVLEESEALSLLRPAMVHSGASGELHIKDCSVMPVALHWAFTHGAWARQLKRSRLVVEGAKSDVNLKLLHHTVVKVTSRHDAFMTLPITIVYMWVFLALVVTHLRIWPRQVGEKALEDWVNGRDPRTSCANNVDTMEAFWEWLLGEEDGIGGVMFAPRPGSQNSSWNYYTLANSHVLVGDMKITKLTYTGEEEHAWLLNSDSGAQELLSGSGYKGAAQMAALSLKDHHNWDASDINELHLSFVTYNEKAKMFGLTSVQITLFEWGGVHVMVNADVVSVDAYHSAGVIVCEVLFVLVILYMAWGECKDMWHALLLGCGEFMDYWQFWNCVDWACIVLGVSLMCTWATCLAAMQAQGLNAILDADSKLTVDVMSLDAGSVAHIMDQVVSLQLRFRWLQFLTAANTVSIVSKFFKAFTSNPRLKVVTDTFRQAGTDFVHFFIIFFTLFLPFTVIGHVLFGNDLAEFSSIGSSFNTGITVMLGDFEWYVEVMGTRSLVGETARLPSGIPVVLLLVWFASYMFLVFLVLLNILLAVIIKHQTQVDEMLTREPDAPTIWAQVAQYIDFKWRARGFKYSLEHVRRMLENDDDPAHGTDMDAEVTVASLMEHFKGMSKEQANYQIACMERELDNCKAMESSRDAETDPNQDFMTEMTSKIDAISDVLNQPLDKEFSSIRKKLGELLTVCDALQRGQKTLCRRVDDLARTSVVSDAHDGSRKERGHRTPSPPRAPSRSSRDPSPSPRNTPPRHPAAPHLPADPAPLQRRPAAAPRPAAPPRHATPRGTTDARSTAASADPSLSRPPPSAAAARAAAASAVRGARRRTSTTTRRRAQTALQKWRGPPRGGTAPSAPTWRVPPKGLGR
ncbi:unnamed protein product, partial [Prorocentrum cordatum]